MKRLSRALALTVPAPSRARADEPVGPPPIVQGGLLSGASSAGGWNPVSVNMTSRPYGRAAGLPRSDG